MFPILNPPPSSLPIPTLQADSLPTERQEAQGNGDPLQYSGQEDPMDRGAWKAAVHVVEKSGTRLKRLSACMVRHTLTMDYKVAA